MSTPSLPPKPISVSFPSPALIIFFVVLPLSISELFEPIIFSTLLSVSVPILESAPLSVALLEERSTFTAVVSL